MPTSTSAAPVTELRDAHATERLGPYLVDLWSRRSYVWYVSLNELRRRQVTTVLGNVWHLLNPALSIGVYYLIFGLLLKTDRGIDNFFLFLAVGLFIFQFTQKSTTEGAKSIVGNAGLLRGVKFPRAMLPLTSTVTETLASLSTFAVMYAIALISGEPAALRWLLFPGVVAIQFFFNLGAALIAARLTTHFRDTTQILPFVFRLLLYASGVIYSVEAYTDENSLARVLFVLNPMFCVISMGRWTIIGDDLPAEVVVSFLLWTVAILLIGFLWFRAGEENYGRD